MQKWNIFKGNLFSVKIDYVLLLKKVIVTNNDCIKLDIWCIYLLEKCVRSVTKHKKMDSIFIWLPLVYTINDQFNLTFVIFIRHI